MTAAPYVVVASLLKHDAMCALFFTHLQPRAPMRIVQFGSDALAAPLSGASALIVIRGLFEFGNMLGCARRLGVPCYYFLDDNFMLIREEAERYGSSYDLYTNDRVRATLKDFAGVLLAADSLIDYFRQHELHPHPVYYPPVTGPVLAASGAADRPFTVAFFGGAHRREPFRRLVYPALCRLAAGRRVRVVTAGVDRDDLKPDGQLDVVALPYNPSYEDALQAVAQQGVDVLVHPSDDTANNIYKNPHVLLNARAIGATAIFSDAPPYRHVESEGIALLAGDSVDAWFNALQQLAADPPRRAALKARLSAYCDAQFGGDRNLAIINGILTRHPQPSWPAARLAVAGACLTAGRVRSRLQRLTPAHS